MFIPKTIHRQREHGQGRAQSGRRLDFAASSPAVRGGPALRRPETDDAPNPRLAFDFTSVYLLCVPRFIQDLLAKECCDGRWQLNRCAG